MIRLFRSSAEKELDGIIAEIRINLQNNYKEPAHNARRRLGERTEELHASGKLKEDAYLRYKKIFDEFTEMMRDYHH